MQSFLPPQAARRNPRLTAERAIAVLQATREALLSSRDPQRFYTLGCECHGVASAVFHAGTTHPLKLAVHRSYDALGSALLDLSKGTFLPGQRTKAMAARKQAVRALGAWRKERLRRAG